MSGSPKTVVLLCMVVAGCASALPNREAPFDQTPEILHRVLPEYPIELQAEGIEGEATIHLIVGPEGAVKQTVVQSSSHPAFGEAAARAVEQWRFKPITVQGRPVHVRFLQRIPFRLRD